MADEKIVSYDFLIDSCISVDAPYGTNPEHLIGQVFIKIIQRARHHDMELVCENIFDAETGEYKDVPEEWYDKKKQTYSAEQMQDDLEPLDE